jgi:magnesium-transporting ATPase (P-type)
VENEKKEYWNISNQVLLNLLKTSPNGLSSIEANEKLIKYGHNTINTHRKTNSLSLVIW